MEIDEWIERYNDMLWRPYALFPPFCHICLRHCAYRNGGYPLSPVFIFNRLGIRCNDLARYPRRMPRGVWSWCCAPQGERNKTAGSPWRLRCFPCCYCGGSRMGRPGLLCSRRFYPNRVCTNLVVAWCFVYLVLHWVVAPLICNLGYGGLSFDTGGSAGRRKGDPPIAERAFCRNNSCPVLPAVLLSSFMESRSRAMGDALCNGRINWHRAFNSSGLPRIGCGHAALLSPRLWSGAGRRVCPFCARSSSHWPCSGCRGGILCKRCHGHCVADDRVRYCRLRMHVAQEEAEQRFGYPPARPTHSMLGRFPLPCRLEKSSLFGCCSKGKRRRRLPGRRVRSHRRYEQRFTEHTGRRRLRAQASSWRCLQVRVML